MYDGDGRRVKKIEAGPLTGTVTTTLYIGDYYETIPGFFERVTDTVIVTNTTWASGTHVIRGTLLVTNAATLRVQGAGVIFARQIIVGPGAAIAADGTGYCGDNFGIGCVVGASPYPGGPGQGYDDDEWAGGGGHGGVGGCSYESRTKLCGPPGYSGATYGDAQSPVTLGSSGGMAGLLKGGNGGGSLHLIADTIQVDGRISANGENGRHMGSLVSGGGAGGSVWVTTPVLTGTGTIVVRGGDTAVHLTPYLKCIYWWPGIGCLKWVLLYRINGSGAGGGGRVALYYAQGAFAASQVNVASGWGGLAGAGTPGTVYLSSTIVTPAWPAYHPTKHYYADGRRIAMRAADPAADTAPLYYLLSDAAGSTVVIADAQGNPVARSRYDPFGGVVATQVWYSDTWSDPTTLPLTYTDRLYRGNPLERALNLYYTLDWRYMGGSEFCRVAKGYLALRNRRGKVYPQWREPYDGGDQNQ